MKEFYVHLLQFSIYFIEIAAPIEPFYSASNMEQLQKADQQIKNGQTVTKTMEELEALAGE